MKTLLLASLLCLPGLALAQPDDDGEEVVIDREVREEREERGERRERRRQKGGPGGEGRVMRRGGPPHGPGMRHPDPEERKAVKRAMELQRETRDISRLLRQNGDPKKKAELEKLVSELFDIRLMLTERRLKHHKDEIERLEKVIASRKAKREELIKQRVDQLTGLDEGMEW